MTHRGGSGPANTPLLLPLTCIATGQSCETESWFSVCPQEHFDLDNSFHIIRCLEFSGWEIDRGWWGSLFHRHKNDTQMQASAVNCLCSDFIDPYMFLTLRVAET